MEATEELTVRLQAQQWNNVMALLDKVEAPHFITDPLIISIRQQCMIAAKMNATTSQAEPMPRSRRPNGPLTPPEDAQSYEPLR